MESEEYHLIGTPINRDEEDPAIFELRINDHITFVDSKEYGLNEISINANDYFITSGDAIQKTKYLKTSYDRLAAQLKEKCIGMISESEGSTKVWNIFSKNLQGKNWTALQSYYNHVEKASKQTARLISLLEDAKGTNVFLETEWNNHRLLCIPKNPRKAMI